MMKSHDDHTSTNAYRVVVCPRWGDILEQVHLFIQDSAPDPFIFPTVVVPGAAHRRSISQYVASHDASASLGAQIGNATGICAGLNTPSLSSLRRRIEADLLGLDPQTDPWKFPTLTAQISALLPNFYGQEWFTLVQHHLTGQKDFPGLATYTETRPGRAVAFADLFAKLVMGYARNAPDLLNSWDVGIDIDASGQPLSSQDKWQAELWRELTHALKEWPHPAQRLSKISHALDNDVGGLTIGNHLGVVSINSFAAADLALLNIIASHADVTIWQLDSSDTAPSNSLLHARYGSIHKQAMASWQLQRANVSSLSSSIASDTAIHNGNIQIHLCHGSDRQVEVLRELLCGLFDADPTLQPRDVAVICTDIARFSPLLAAYFEPTDDLSAHPGHHLRTAIAGSSIARFNDVAETLLSLLTLPTSRATADDLVALCSAPPVANKFGFDEDSLARIAELIGRAEIRWGIDAAHRSQWGLSVRQSTWLSGIERLLAGLTTADIPPTHFDTVTPVSHLESTEADLIGNLAELISRVRCHLLEFRTPADLSVWHHRLTAAVDDLTAPNSDDQWQLNHLSQQLAQISAGPRSNGTLTAADIAALLAHCIEPQKGHPNFGNGSLLMCGLDDIQAIQHRVTVLLGVDDAHFPPRPHEDHDDLLARANIVTPPPTNADKARQQLLNAIESAQEQLIVIGTGIDPLTGAKLPQSTVISDLLAASNVSGGPNNQTHQKNIYWHSLQPHDPANFTSFFAGNPLSFDARAFKGAQALATPKRSSTSDWRSAEQSTATHHPGGIITVDLADLIDFFTDPAKAWFGHTYGFIPYSSDDNQQTDLPLQIDALTQYKLGSAMLEGLLAGQDESSIEAAALLSGELPPAKLSSPVLSSMWPEIKAMVRHINAAHQSSNRNMSANQHQIHLSLGHHLLTGSCQVDAGRLINYRYGHLRGVDLIGAWIRLIAASASETPATEAVIITRDGATGLDAISTNESLTLLTELLALRERGLSKLCPLPIQTAWAYASARSRNASGSEYAGSKAFSRETKFSPLWRDYLRMNWRDLSALPAEPSDPITASPSRFTNLSLWLFEPILRSQHTWPASQKEMA